MSDQKIASSNLTNTETNSVSTSRDFTQSNLLPHQKIIALEVQFISELENIGNTQIDLVDNLRLSTLQIDELIPQKTLEHDVKNIAENHWKLYSQVLSKVGVETMPIQDSMHGKNHRLDFVQVSSFVNTEDTHWNFHMFFTNTATALENGYVIGAETFLEKIKNHYLAITLSEIVEIRRKSQEYREKIIKDVDHLLAEQSNPHSKILLNAIRAYVTTLEKEERKFEELLKKYVDEVEKVIKEVGEVV